MKPPTIINSFESLDELRDNRCGCESLDESKDIENCPKFPDAHLSSGILLTMLLVAIYSFIGGVSVIVIAACIVIVGLGLGLLWKHHFPYRVYSITTVPLSSSKSYQWTNAKTHWITQNDRRIFFDTALNGYYM